MAINIIVLCYFQLCFRVLIGCVVNLFFFPAVCCLVRGFEEDSDMIQINTNLRSRKVSDIFFYCVSIVLVEVGSVACCDFIISLQIQELKLCPSSELCWYFSDTWEQFQINGRVEVIDASSSDQISGKAYVNLSCAWYALQQRATRSR
ncbi:unnamed protein product, partial [Eruca vesicaria subsp. sativa]|nr:unnamed protein product [Eruca vesicaria subsp. sativa]